MSTTVSVAGINYVVPVFNDPASTGWGTSVSNLLIALAANIASSPTFMQLVNVSATPQSMVSGKTYLVTTASIAIQLNLPTPAANAWFIIKDVSASAATHNITVHRAGSEQIDGSSSDKVLSRSAGTWFIMGDGTNWWTINEFPDTGLVLADLSSAFNLPINRGGTNSVATLNNNRVMVSSGSAIVEAGALTAARVICSDSNGLPTAAPAATVSLSKPLAFVTTTDGIVGTTTNDSASAGNVGQYVSSTISSPTNFPATGNIGDLTSISLTAGDWDVSGALACLNNGASITGGYRIGISTTSGNAFTGLTEGDNYLFAAASAATDVSASVPSYRVSLSGTTTVYLKYMCSAYSAATPQAQGRISARRVR